jgi:hypothetical protein
VPEGRHAKLLMDAEISRRLGQTLQERLNLLTKLTQIADVRPIVR